MVHWLDSATEALADVRGASDPYWVCESTVSGEWSVCEVSVCDVVRVSFVVCRFA